MEYEEALRLQLRVVELKRRGMDQDFLFLLEHPPTITVGRNADWSHLLIPKEELTARGIQVFEADRGGDITFHGPGQLVGYPILQLRDTERDVHAFMRNLEESLIRALSHFGIEGTREDAYTGVWTEMGKIAALGVHLSRWITRHGFALNVSTDLSFFDLIVPCGIRGRRAASMDRLTEQKITVEQVAWIYAREFGVVFGREPFWLKAEALRQELELHD